MVNVAEKNRESKPQKLRATATIAPIMAPLNIMVNVVINDEDSADGMLPASEEDVLELELDANCTAEIGLRSPVSHTK